MFYDLKVVRIASLLLLAVLTAAAQTEPVALKSPDGALEISIATVQGQSVQAAGGQLAYRVAFRGQPVLGGRTSASKSRESPRWAGYPDRVVAASSQDETWTPVAGKASSIRNHYNAVTVQTVETAATGRRLAMEARAYDDGVAFRYVVPEQASVTELRILNESTQFRFSKDATRLPLILRGFQTSNEDDYHELTISGLHPEYLVNLPLLLEVPGVAWVGLTEADIEDYPNLFVTGADGHDAGGAAGDPRRGHEHQRGRSPPPFDPKADASKVSVIAQTPVRSGWRVLMIADQPGRLVESNMVVNLNPPSAIGDTSWIKPGKTAWDWWNGSQAKGVARTPA